MKNLPSSKWCDVKMEEKEKEESKNFTKKFHEIKPTNQSTDSLNDDFKRFSKWKKSIE